MKIKIKETVLLTENVTSYSALETTSKGSLKHTPPVTIPGHSLQSAGSSYDNCRLQRSHLVNKTIFTELCAEKASENLRLFDIPYTAEVEHTLQYS